MGSPATYRVCVEGRVPAEWSSRFQGMEIAPADDEERSNLVGQLADQAALSGLLNTLYDYEFPVVSVECLDVDRG
jgi:hypothetical protein